jgi:hypothetical protein
MECCIDCQPFFWRALREERRVFPYLGYTWKGLTFLRPYQHEPYPLESGAFMQYRPIVAFLLARGTQIALGGRSDGGFRTIPG